LEELERNLAKWRQSGTRTYNYLFQRSCYATLPAVLPVLLRVEHNRVTNGVRLDTFERLLSDEREYFDVTIEDIFLKLREALEQNAYRVHVAYDPEMGYPRELRIDKSERIADDETTYFTRVIEDHWYLSPYAPNASSRPTIRAALLPKKGDGAPNIQISVGDSTSPWLSPGDRFLEWRFDGVSGEPVHFRLSKGSDTLRLAMP
jgi:hypothetical protein